MFEPSQNGAVSKQKMLFIGLIFVLGLSLLFVAAQQNGPKKPAADNFSNQSGQDPVVAILGGDPITESQIEMASTYYSAGLKGGKVELTREQVLERLVQQKLLSKLGETQKLAENVETQNRLLFAREQILAEEAVADFLKDAVSEADISAHYEKERQILTSRIQIKARQIVLPDAATAKEIQRRLKGGEAFASLALAYSIDRASREAGGNLGYLNQDMLDPLLSSQIFASQDGAQLEPFETPQGWHVVEVINRRKTPIPGLDERREDIIQLLQSQKLQARLTRLKQDARLQILDNPENDDQIQD